MFNLGLSLVALLSSTAQASAPLPSAEINRLIDGSFRFIVSEQKTETQYPLYWSGEFPSFMENRKSIIALGPAHLKAPDSNCFTSVLMYEELAKLYPELGERSEYASLLNRTFSNIMSFRYGESFNFWHSLPRNERMIRSTPKRLRETETFRPNQYPLTNRFADVRSNIANDADDTALAFAAIDTQKKFALKSSAFDLPNWQPTHPSALFAQYVDAPDRRGKYPNNILHGNFHHTGAFLTWLSPEKIPFLVSPLKSWKADLRIPEGVNNFDCVVNANVLRSLMQTEGDQAPGFQSACQYINDAVARGFEKTCGIYYPNPYTLHYAVGKALASGVSCLQPAGEILLDKIVAEQNANGSFEGGSFEEPVQSTLFATHALISLTHALERSAQTDSAIEKAVHSLHDARIESSRGISWPAGSFFSGGGFVRNLLSWKSEAFSTAMALSIFSEYRKMNAARAHD